MSSHRQRRKIRNAANVGHYIGMENDGALCIGMESSMDTMEKSCVRSKEQTPLGERDHCV